MISPCCLCGCFQNMIGCVACCSVSLLESALVPLASSIYIEQHKKQQKSGRNMVYACPLDCLECFLPVCVLAAVHQQAVHLEHESFFTHQPACACTTKWPRQQLGQVTALAGSRVFIEYHLFLHCLNSLGNTQFVHSSTVILPTPSQSPVSFHSYSFVFLSFVFPNYNFVIP